MSGATVISIIFGVFATIVVGTIAVFFGRIVWAMRNPEKFKAFHEREAAAEKARRQKSAADERERIRLGKPSWAGRFFGTVFTLAGFYVVALSIWQIYEITRAQFWIRSECTILRSGVASSSSGRSATTFRPEVEYSYSFDGQNYMGDRLNLPRNSYLSSDEAQRAIKNYPRGSFVDCYVNSKIPAESVLDRSPLRFPLYRNGLGILICFGVGGFILYVSRRRKPLENLSKESQIKV